ncbi:MAG: response regulator transcription factor [Sulfitobacter sp.]
MIAMILDDAMQNDVYSVLIVDDHVHTAARFGASIDAEPALATCAIAYDLRTGLDALAVHKPRIVLTDLGLPDGDGIEIVKAIAAADWTCDCLVISVFGDEERILRSIRAGAKGYILKNSPNEDIARDTLSVIAGGSPISPKIARHLISQFTSSPSAKQPAGSAVSLTPREVEILNAIAKGFKREEIADILGIAIGTVGNHINNIYKKLEVRSGIEAVSEANSLGIL